MTKKEIIQNAKFLQFPYIGNGKINKYDYEYIYENNKYFIFTEKDFTKNDLYTDKLNLHYFKTRWHYDKVLPVLEMLLNFGYDKNDFFLIEDGEHSFMLPKEKQYYSVIYPVVIDFSDEMYDLKFIQQEINSNEITSCSTITAYSKIERSKYHELFKFSHEPVIIKYLKKTIILDNRYSDYNLSFFNLYNIEDEKITDILIQTWKNVSQEKYLNFNL